MDPLQVVAFDLDGTLFNSGSVSYDSIREGFEAFWSEIGVEGVIPSWDDARQLIGLPSFHFYPSLLPDEYKERWEILHKYVGDAEKAHLAAGRGRTFHGVHETLTELKQRGHELRCLSNASKGYFDAVIDECRLRHYFTRLDFLGQDFSRGKVHVLEEWAMELGETDRIFYVGDRAGDIGAAHEAGIEAVAVSFGYGTREELMEAEAVIDRMPDLLKVLTPWSRLVFRITSIILDARHLKSKDRVIRLPDMETTEKNKMSDDVSRELENHGLKVDISCCKGGLKIVFQC